MAELTLQFDNRACQSIDDLMRHYNVNSRAELISKAIYILKLAAHVSQTDGELIARKNGEETRITVR